MNALNANNCADKSLVNENLFAVLLPESEGFGFTADDFPALRKGFFENGEKTVRLNRSGIVKGLEGKIKGKMTAQSFYWKKTAGGVDIEESFSNRQGYLIVKRNYDSVITARIHFRKNHTWIKSEYFDTGCQSAGQPASIVLKPAQSGNGAEQLTYDAQTRTYATASLYCAPYPQQPAQQSILNARFGPPALVAYTARGSFSYCPDKAEASRRAETLAQLQEGTVLLLPAWEVQDGELKNTELNAEFTETSAVQFPGMDKSAILPQAENQNLTEEIVGSEKAAEEIAASEKYKNTLPDSAGPAQVITKNVGAQPFSPVPEASVAAQTGQLPETPAAAVAKEEAALLPVQPGSFPDAETTTAPEHPAVKEAAASEAVPAKPGTDTTYILEAAKQLEAQTAPESFAVDPDSLPPKESAVRLTETMPFQDDTELSDIFSAIQNALERKAEDAAPAALSIQTVKQLPGNSVCLQQKNGYTAYQGGYHGGKREGFGSYYYKDGSLCYAGFWEDDKKEGLGVSFRHSDQAVHISNWKENKPAGFTSLFDKQGNFKFGGKIVAGKKNGVGISYNNEDGSVFVGKWENGVHTGYGSTFDENGNLLYTGMWKHGKRSGTGTAFDQAGDILFTGEWKEDHEYNGILYKKPRPEAEQE